MRQQHQASRQEGNNQMSTPSPQFRNLLLTHWRAYHPTMYQEMVQANTLEAMLDAAALRLDELLYTLVVEQQMEYAAAWEIAIEQFLLPEEGSDSTSQNQS
jgi:hypothetical protein